MTNLLHIYIYIYIYIAVIFLKQVLYITILLYMNISAKAITHSLGFHTNNLECNCSYFKTMHTCFNAIYFFFNIMISPRQHFVPILKGLKCSTEINVVYTVCYWLSFLFPFCVMFTTIKLCHIQYAQFIPFLFL